jgi:hypothetical protein
VKVEGECKSGLLKKEQGTVVQSFKEVCLAVCTECEDNRTRRMKEGSSRKHKDREKLGSLGDKVLEHPKPCGVKCGNLHACMECMKNMTA